MWSRRLDQRKRWRSISYILLEWIIQSLSRQSPAKGGPASVCTGALWSEGSRISLHTDRSKRACQRLHTLSFHFSLVYVCVVCVWGGEPPFALEPWWPLRSPSHFHGCIWPPPFALNPSAAFSSSLLPTLSLPSSCNYITCTMSF